MKSAAVQQIMCDFYVANTICVIKCTLFTCILCFYFTLYFPFSAMISDQVQQVPPTSCKITQFLLSAQQRPGVIICFFLRPTSIEYDHTRFHRIAERDMVRISHSTSAIFPSSASRPAGKKNLNKVSEFVCPGAGPETWSCRLVPVPIVDCRSRVQAYSVLKLCHTSAQLVWAHHIQVHSSCIGVLLTVAQL